MADALSRGEYLIVVDANNRASQFVLADGRISPDTLILKRDVQDVAFNGSRVLFRTARWVHRASVSVTGLVALDSVLVPKTLNGGRMVNGLSSDGRTIANRTYLPVMRDGVAELHVGEGAEIVGKTIAEAGLRDRDQPRNFGIAFASLMAMTAMLIHATVDFPLQIPANAAWFVVLCLLPFSIQERNGV